MGNLYFKQVNNDILYKYNNDNWNIASFPFTFSTINVFFESDIHITNSSQYLICNPNLIFTDFTIGNPDSTTNITIDGITGGYNGFIQNGTFQNYNSLNITIQNINIKVINGSLLGITTIAENAYVGNGWLCQSFFGYNDNITTAKCFINNCSSDGDIISIDRNYIGGIGGLIGSYSCVNTTNCISTGLLTQSNGGGIYGSNCIYSVAQNCI